jgi:flagellar basal-body rod protein FlgF
MGFGIPASINGAKAKELELEVIANNIANIQTNGFKEMLLTFSAQDQTQSLKGTEEDLEELSKNLPGTAFTNFKQGSVFGTDNPLDVALQGDGFFEIQTQAGTRYTRNGHFTVNSNGTLITQQGDIVQTTSGTLTVPQDKPLVISADGTISSGDTNLGVLKIVNFAKPGNLKAMGNNYYSSEGETPLTTGNFNVAQGHLESSNVNLMSNITRMIMVSRSYEAHQKSVTQQIEAEKMLNKIANV